MKNSIIYKLKSKVKLEIKGKNINRFLIRLNNNNIEILKCTTIDKETINIIIYSKDLSKLEKIKTIYNISEIDEYGLIKIKKKLSLHKYLIISIIIGYLILVLLSNIISDVEIIYNDEKTRTFLKQELAQYGIKEKTIKKNYQQIEMIKQELLDKYKDKIEWIEIETKGTKYIVRVELRKIESKSDVLPNRNIVSKKDAIIKEIKSSRGEIVKKVNDYVKKGDVIISGDIKVEEDVKEMVPAQGEVYGEVWYEIDVKYPFAYIESKPTNNKKTVYVLKIFNKNIELFNSKPFKNKKIEDKIIFKNNIFPIALSKQKQTEEIKIEEILTTDLAISKATKKGIEKISESLKPNEYIINYKIINTNIKENELELKLFFSVYENITEYQNSVNENN